MAPHRTGTKARHQRAIGQLELEGLQRLLRLGQRHQARAVGREGQRHRGHGGNGVVAARRLELHLKQRIAVLRRARHPTDADKAGFGPQVQKFLGAARALAHIAQRRPRCAVVRGLDGVLLGIGVLPHQLHRAQIDHLAKVKLDPRVVFKLAGPARAGVAIHRHGCRRATVL